MGPVTKALVAVVARVFISGFGIAAIVWAVIVLPRFWTEAAAYQVASRIIAGDMYSHESLAGLAASLESDGKSWTHPAALGPASIIQLRQTEEAIARGEQGDSKSRLLTLDRTIVNSLTSSPYASFQWLALYWTENRLNGFNPRYLQYLRMSYDVGPLEGWVAVRRSPIALRLYAVLTDDLKNAAHGEFIGLVRSQFYADAAGIFGGSTPTVREKLLAQLANLKDSEKRLFDKVLLGKGLFDTPSSAGPARPWQ